MWSGLKAVLFLGAVALLDICCADAACASTMGSLGPHDASAAPDAKQQWIADPRSNCRALDSDFDPDDSISWQGDCVGGLISGSGTLSFLNKGQIVETITGTFGGGVLEPGRVSAVWADGARYDGNQSDGQFDGTGIFISATADKLSGEWKAGALDGNASVAWANGDRYDGAWKNGKSDGEGTEIWANGDRYQGLWRDGQPLRQETPARRDAAGDATTAPREGPEIHAAAPTLASSAISTPAPASLPVKIVAAESATEAADAAAETGSGALPLHLFMGKTLVAVDGSTIDLASGEGGLTRVVTLPNGIAQRASFDFMNGRIGTVSIESSAVGLFRSSADEIDIDYADGTIETMKPDPAGGLVTTAQAPGGGSSCTAWYAAGHIFGQDEKKAAVLEYASRLGVAAPATPRKHRGARPASHICGGAFVANVADASAAIGYSGNGAMKNAVWTSSRAPLIAQSAPTGEFQVSPRDSSLRLQQIPIRESAVHLIDAPYEFAANQPLVRQASFSTDPVALRPAGAAAAAPVAPAAPNPSECLSVTSDGEYWGFQNRCARPLQFAYCEMSDANPLMACGRTRVPGSVTANGFSPLVSDRSLSEQNVKHDFRWLACDGGAGEVIARLDSVEPPAGRCMRAVPATDSSRLSSNSEGS